MIVEREIGQDLIDEAVTEIFTILDILRWTISRLNSAQVFYGHGTDNPWDEAVRLVLPSLFLPMDIPNEMYNARLTSSERVQVVKQVIRRINARIPVSYLTHQAWFCGLEFYVDERVLIPRSPISELINDHFRDLLPHPPSHILDMCTGSGCIAIASAYVYPDTKIDAVDISKDALIITEKNIRNHGVEQQVTTICSDLFKNLPIIAYDLIITNPPYVDEKSMKNLPEEFHAEPILGLFARDDGLEFIRRILACSSNYLSDNGILICEVGNRMIPLIKLYPKVNFLWLKLYNGGEGVFMLTRQQLLNCSELFKLYRD